MNVLLINSLVQMLLNVGDQNCVTWVVGIVIQYRYLLMHLVDADKNSVSRGV